MGAFRQGFVVEVLNPKTALFFVAFLPQFVDSDARERDRQVASWAAPSWPSRCVVDATYAVLASTAGRLLSGGQRVDRAGGLALLALAAAAAA